MNEQMRNDKAGKASRATAFGTRTAIAVAILLLVLTAVNLLVRALPDGVTRFDTTADGITKISSETKRFLREIDTDVTIYWLCQGKDTDEQFSLLLARYTEGSDRIRVEVIDPLADTDFVAKYTSSSLSNYSFIVESDQRYQIIDSLNLYYFTNDFVDSMTGSPTKLTYEQLYSYYSNELTAYYLQSSTTTQYFQGEAVLTSAIDYVTQPSIPHAYILDGHGDRAPSEILLAMMDSRVERVDLRDAEQVPADAASLVLFAPEDDLTEHEASLIKDYMAAGGSFLLITGPEQATYPHILSLGAEFGLSAEEGILHDPGTGAHVGDAVDRLVPTVNSNHVITYFVAANGYGARMPKSHGIHVNETLPTGVTVTPLMTTSEQSYRVSPDDGETALGEAGIHNVAVAAQKTVVTAEGTEDTASFAWFASVDAFTDELAVETSGGNYYYLSEALVWMSEPFSSAYSSLASVDMSGSVLTGLTTTLAIVWGVLIVVLIPLGLLITGIVIWIKRRSR